MLVPFFFCSSKSKYKLLTAIYLTNTEKSWLRSVLLQQATSSKALTNAKRHARKKFLYLFLECSTYKIKEHSQGSFICFMMKNRFISPRLTSNFQNTAWQLTSVFNTVIKHPSLFQPIRVRVLSELYHNCLLLKNEIAATVDAQVSVKRTIGKVIAAFNNTPSSKVKSINLSGP